MQLLIGTNNRGKVQEVKDCLRHLPHSLLTPEEMGISGVPEESGETYTDNALIKARYFWERSGKVPTVAEDAGIVVEALPGELGVKTRRWGAGPDVTDHEWISYFLKRMDSETDRRASFFSVVSFIDAEGNEYNFEGSCSGIITETIEAPFREGLPFDGCFRPEGYDCVYGELCEEDKNRTSHRGRALRKLATFLSSYGRN